MTVEQLRALDGAAQFLNAARAVGSAVVRTSPGHPTREMALLAGAEIADERHVPVHAVLEAALHPFLASWIRESFDRPIHLHSPKDFTTRPVPAAAVLVVISEGGGPQSAPYEGELLAMAATHPLVVLRDPANVYRAASRLHTVATRQPARFSFTALRPARQTRR
ncbi:hypothetical protein [Cellulosimicrobium sp. Marseille-Q4280]|uniref:hypothetical protein n=1 Tax=Cellulosimicrobium sp. Marseille-Q4280 TaxID=2937992 RepID=UPI00203D564F|nr:hypothetical protein [Cellulosimicrobium sp. Marseille-Q4280]